MEMLALELGRHLFYKRFGCEPDWRVEERSSPVTGSLMEIDASNAIWVLFDVSENNQTFRIDSDNCRITSQGYFKNQVPTKPQDLTGNILIDTRGSTAAVVFTFLVFYQ